MGTTEKVGSLQRVLQILKETAEKFDSLYQEADDTLRSRRDLATRRKKLEERAQLLIDLPNRLSGTLENLDSEVKQEIMRSTEWFATCAKEALDKSESGFMLSVLLTHPGNDKNELEELIALLESE